MAWRKSSVRVRSAPHSPASTRVRRFAHGQSVGHGRVSPIDSLDMEAVLPDDADPDDEGRRMTEFFASLVPGRLGCVFDHAAKDLVVGHIDVTENLIAGTGYLF